MWRIRTPVLLATAIAVLLLGGLVAEGGWWWNAQLDVEGVDVRTAWTVSGDDNPDNYKARIVLVVPKGVDASIVDTADNEIVRVRESGRLRCTPDGIETRAFFQVKPTSRQATGNRVTVSITADDEVVAMGTGKLTRRIRIDAFIPVDGPSCATDEHDDDDEDE